MTGEQPAALAGITSPAQTWALPVVTARGIATLRRDFPRWSVWMSRSGRVWAASTVCEHPGSGQTLTADNPALMRDELMAAS